MTISIVNKPELGFGKRVTKPVSEPFGLTVISTEDDAFVLFELLVAAAIKK